MLMEQLRVCTTAFVEFAASLLKYRDVANCSGVPLAPVPLIFPAFFASDPQGLLSVY